MLSRDLNATDNTIVFCLLPSDLVFTEWTWYQLTAQYRHACTQITSTKSPRQPNFVQLSPMFVGAEYETCFMLPSWRLEFWGGPYTFGKCMHPWSLFMETVKEQQIDVHTDTEDCVRPMATDCNLNNPLPVLEFGSLDGIYSDAAPCY